MKGILFTLAIVFAAGAAQAQAPVIYQCVRPDGTVVCTVRDKSGDPSVTCNYECVDCNMVCVARVKVTTEEDGRMAPVVPPKVKGERRKPGAGGVETKEYCRSVYQDCLAKCKSDPKNKTKYDRDACVSSCESWYSGCGTQR